MWLSVSGILVLFLYVNPILSREVCPDSVIKEAIISLAHIMRENSQKLERHEVRERQLGEWMKKSVGALNKRVVSFDSFKTDFSKIEERMAGIEQLISQRDERERIQMQKTANMIENLENRLAAQINQINSTIYEVSRSVEPTPAPVKCIMSDIISKLNETEAKLMGQVARIEFDLNATGTKNEAAAKKQTKALEALSAEKDESERQQIEKTKKLIEDLEKRLMTQIEKINGTIYEVTKTGAQCVGQVERIESGLNATATENKAAAAKQTEALKTLSDERDERENRQIEKTAKLIENLEKRLTAQIERINETILEVGSLAAATPPTLTAESITSDIISKLNETEANFVGHVALIEFGLNDMATKNEAEATKRAKALETLSAERGEGERKQIEATANLIENLEKHLVAQIETINGTISEVGRCVEPTSPTLAAESITSDILSKLNETEAQLVGQVARVQSGLNAMTMENKAEAVEKATQLQTLFSEVRNISSKLTDIEGFLEELNEVTKKGDDESAEKADNVTALIQKQKEALNKVTELLQGTANRVQELPTQLDVEAFHNETQEALQETKSALEDAVRNGTSEVINRVDENTKAIKNSLETLKFNLTDDLQRVNGELGKLVRGQEAMIPALEDLMNMKNKVVFTVLQIIGEVSTMINDHDAAINKTLHDKFDVILSSILNNQSNAFNNLSTKMDQEIEEVWRQMNIMNEAMSKSANAIDELQKQNGVYVNGTAFTLDGMETKISDISTHMNTVNENLNVLLGRLNLTTHEFIRIKTAVAEALSNMKNSFKELEKKTEDLPSLGRNPLPTDEHQNFPDTNETTTLSDSLFGDISN